MTAQFEDELIHNGKTHFLEDEILGPFLEESKLMSKTDGHLTALWRGYIAVFEIKNFEIHLKQLKFVSEDETLFNDIISKLGTTKLNYLSRLIVLYQNHVEGNWTVKSMNKFDTYEVLEFKNGILNDFKILNYAEFEQFKSQQFNGFINSPEYLIAKTNRINYFESENERLRIMKEKKSQWHKYKFKEEEFLNEVKNYILRYTKKFY